jgi:hypothetical protein
VEAALNSLKVEQKSDRVQLNASIPRALIEKMFETPTEPEPEKTQPTPKPHSNRHRKRR